VTERLVWLCDGQGEGLAGSAASAAYSTGVSAWSVDGNAGCSWAHDGCGRKRDLQLGTAQDLGAESRPVDNGDGRRHDVTAIDGEQESLLHLRERDGGVRERGNGRGGTGASAQRIQGVAALQSKHGEQQRAEESQTSVNSFHHQ